MLNFALTEFCEVQLPPFMTSRKSVKKLRIIGHLRDALYVLVLVD